ncbi:hypothetical protein Tco_1176964 [Tanacetum coccineum]
MPTEMELTLEQTQQGVSYEVSNIRVISLTMKMEILLELTSNKLMVEHAEYDESNTYVLERFNTAAGNPVKKILLKLNLSDHRSILMDLKEYLKMVMENLHVPPVDTTESSLHELDLLFSPMYEEYFTAAYLIVSKSSDLSDNLQQQGTQPTLNVQPKLELITYTPNVNAEETNTDQAADA